MSKDTKQSTHLKILERKLSKTLFDRLHRQTKIDEYRQNNRFVPLDNEPVSENISIDTKRSIIKALEKYTDLQRTIILKYFVGKETLKEITYEHGKNASYWWRFLKKVKKDLRNEILL